jgi:hypothetical protein
VHNPQDLQRSLKHMTPCVVMAAHARAACLGAALLGRCELLSACGRAGSWTPGRLGSALVTRRRRRRAEQRPRTADPPLAVRGSCNARQPAWRVPSLACALSAEAEGKARRVEPGFIARKLHCMLGTILSMPWYVGRRTPIPWIAVF